MSVCLSNLDNEGADIIFGPLNDELRKDDSMICHSAHVAWPPFRGGWRWCMYHKLICFLVKGRSSLQVSHIRSVTKLCLCIASKYPQVPRERQPFLRLLLGRQRLNERLEHHVMHRVAALTQLRKLPTKSSSSVPVKPVRPQLISVLGLLEHVLHLLWPRHVVEFVRVGQFWVFLHIFISLLDHCPFDWINARSQGFCLVEVTLVSLLLEI